MKFLIGSLLALVATIGSSASEEFELTFDPSDGDELTLDYVRVFALELDSSESHLTYDGEDQGDQDTPGIEYSMTETETIRFTDTYSVEKGNLVGIHRHFELIGNVYAEEVTDPTGETYEEQDTGTSELEDAVVVFEWDAEAEEFDVRLGEDSEDLDEELLEDLDARAALADLLPDHAVSTGDSWEIDVSAFIRMTNLSGDLHVVQESDNPDEPDDEYGEQFDENLKGDFTAEFVELRDVEGVSIAVLKLTADLETSFEVSNEVSEDGMEGTEEENHTFEFELEGELLWDVKGRHASSLTLLGDITLEMKAVKTYSFSGHDLVMTEAQEFSGSLDFKASIDG